MSTKAIEAALRLLKEVGETANVCAQSRAYVELATSELERIRSASRVVVDVLSSIPPQYDTTEPMTHALDVLSDVAKESK